MPKYLNDYSSESDDDGSYGYNAGIRRHSVDKKVSPRGNSSMLQLEHDYSHAVSRLRNEEYDYLRQRRARSVSIHRGQSVGSSPIGPRSTSRGSYGASPVSSRRQLDASSVKRNRQKNEDDNFSDSSRDYDYDVRSKTHSRSGDYYHRNSKVKEYIDDGYEIYPPSAPSREMRTKSIDRDSALYRRKRLVTDERSDYPSPPTKRKSLHSSRSRSTATRYRSPSPSKPYLSVHPLSPPPSPTDLEKAGRVDYGYESSDASSETSPSHSPSPLTSGRSETEENVEIDLGSDTEYDLEGDDDDDWGSICTYRSIQSIRSYRSTQSAKRKSSSRTPSRRSTSQHQERRRSVSKGRGEDRKPGQGQQSVLPPLKPSVHFDRTLEKLAWKFAGVPVSNLTGDFPPPQEDVDNDDIEGVERERRERLEAEEAKRRERYNQLMQASGMNFSTNDTIVLTSATASAPQQPKRRIAPTVVQPSNPPGSVLTTVTNQVVTPLSIAPTAAASVEHLFPSTSSTAIPSLHPPQKHGIALPQAPSALDQIISRVSQAPPSTSFPPLSSNQSVVSMAGSSVLPVYVPQVVSGMTVFVPHMMDGKPLYIESSAPSNFSMSASDTPSIVPTSAPTIVSSAPNPVMIHPSPTLPENPMFASDSYPVNPSRNYSMQAPGHTEAQSFHSDKAEPSLSLLSVDTDPTDNLSVDANFPADFVAPTPSTRSTSPSVLSVHTPLATAPTTNGSTMPSSAASLASSVAPSVTISVISAWGGTGDQLRVREERVLSSPTPSVHTFLSPSVLLPSLSPSALPSSYPSFPSETSAPLPPPILPPSSNIPRSPSTLPPEKAPTIIPKELRWYRPGSNTPLPLTPLPKDVELELDIEATASGQEEDLRQWRERRKKYLAELRRERKRSMSQSKDSTGKSPAKRGRPLKDRTTVSTTATLKTNSSTTSVITTASATQPVDVLTTLLSPAPRKRGRPRKHPLPPEPLPAIASSPTSSSVADPDPILTFTAPSIPPLPSFSSVSPVSAASSQTPVFTPPILVKPTGTVFVPSRSPSLARLKVLRPSLKQTAAPTPSPASSVPPSPSPRSSTNHTLPSVQSDTRPCIASPPSSRITGPKVSSPLASPQVTPSRNQICARSNLPYATNSPNTSAASSPRSLQIVTPTSARANASDSPVGVRFAEENLVLEFSEEEEKRQRIRDMQAMYRRKYREQKLRAKLLEEAQKTGLDGEALSLTGLVESNLENQNVTTPIRKRDHPPLNSTDVLPSTTSGVVASIPDFATLAAPPAATIRYLPPDVPLPNSPTSRNPMLSTTGSVTISSVNSATTTPAPIAPSTPPPKRGGFLASLKGTRIPAIPSPSARNPTPILPSSPAATSADGQKSTTSTITLPSLPVTPQSPSVVALSPPLPRSPRSSTPKALTDVSLVCPITPVQVLSPKEAFEAFLRSSEKKKPIEPPSPLPSVALQQKDASPSPFDRHRMPQSIPSSQSETALTSEGGGAIPQPNDCAPGNPSSLANPPETTSPATTPQAQYSSGEIEEKLRRKEETRKRAEAFLSQKHTLHIFYMFRGSEPMVHSKRGSSRSSTSSTTESATTTRSIADLSNIPSDTKPFPENFSRWTGKDKLRALAIHRDLPLLPPSTYWQRMAAKIPPFESRVDELRQFILSLQDTRNNIDARAGTKRRQANQGKKENIEKQETAKKNMTVSDNDDGIINNSEHNTSVSIVRHIIPTSKTIPPMPDTDFDQTSGATIPSGTAATIPITSITSAVSTSRTGVPKASRAPRLRGDALGTHILAALVAEQPSQALASAMGTKGTGKRVEAEREVAKLVATGRMDVTGAVRTRNTFTDLWQFSSKGRLPSSGRVMKKREKEEREEEEGEECTVTAGIAAPRVELLSDSVGDRTSVEVPDYESAFSEEQAYLQAKNTSAYAGIDTTYCSTSDSSFFDTSVNVSHISDTGFDSYTGIVPSEINSNAFANASPLLIRKKSHLPEGTKANASSQIRDDTEDNSFVASEPIDTGASELSKLLQRQAKSATKSGFATDLEGLLLIGHTTSTKGDHTNGLMVRDRLANKSTTVTGAATPSLAGFRGKRGRGKQVVSSDVVVKTESDAAQPQFHRVGGKLVRGVAVSIQGELLPTGEVRVTTKANDNPEWEDDLDLSVIEDELDTDL